MIKVKHQHSRSNQEAWNKADKLFPTDYEKDEFSSQRAGYSIYRSTAEGSPDYICDLGSRLELNIDSKNEVINIWIDPKHDFQIEVEDLADFEEDKMVFDSYIKFKRCLKMFYSERKYSEFEQYLEATMEWISKFHEHQPLATFEFDNKRFTISVAISYQN